MKNLPELDGPNQAIPDEMLIKLDSSFLSVNKLRFYQNMKRFYFE